MEVMASEPLRMEPEAPIKPNRFGRADLQVHTAHGDGMEDARDIFERVELRG